jgi:hypothetical protein
MTSCILEAIATDQNFDEKAYLLANPDVADAIKKGTAKSGRSHFDAFGKNENRRMRFSSPSILLEAKRRKLERIKPLLRSDMQCIVCFR